MIVIRVNMREARAIRAYSLHLASNNHPLTEGISPWNTYRSVIREAATAVQFQVDPDEQRELNQRGVPVKQGMAFIDPQTAMSLMITMANDESAFKDVPTITSVVRKIAQKLGQAMPKIASPAPRGKPSDPINIHDRPSEVPGAAKARQTEVPNAIAPWPGQSTTRQQDIASMKGAGKPQTTVQDPSQQERTPDMEDPEKWFREAKSLLNRSPWGLMEEDEDAR